MEKFNQQQLDAINYFDSPLLIVAGPGTGKTSVLTEKIVKIIEREKVKGNNVSNKILVCTFTNKGAEELKGRLKTKLGDDVENMYISTIHSFCQKMLEEFPEYNDFGANFTVLDDVEQYLFIRKQIDYKLGLFEYKQVLKERSGMKQPTEELLNLFNYLSENYVDPDKLINEIKTGVARENQEFDLKAVEAYKLYLEDMLNSKDFKLDFALLQKVFLDLMLKHEEFMTKLRDKFYYILIDEYQDTNPIQDKIFKLISEPRFNLTAVGDEDQSIYGFRGASIENFRKFEERYPNAKVLKLENNYRSFSDIVEMSDNFIKPQRDKEKTIKSMRGSFTKPLLIVGESKTEVVDGEEVKVHPKYDEANKVVEFIDEQVKLRHFEYGDVAILFKSVRNQVEPYTKAFNQLNIPTQIVGDSSLFDIDYISKILRFMGFVSSFELPSSKRESIVNFKYSNFLTNEIIGISKDLEIKFDEKLKLVDFDYERIFNEDIFNELNIVDEDRNILKEISSYKHFLDENKISMIKIYYHLILNFGFLERFVEESKKENSILKLKNLGTFSEVLFKFNEIANSPNFRTLFWFLYTLPENKIQDAASVEENNSVKLMTIHQSKGLEFPVVIMAGLTNKRFGQDPRENSYIVDVPISVCLSETKFNAAEESRRVFYVAMTRAQDLLIFASIKDKSNKVSKFLLEDIGEDKFSTDIKLDKPIESKFRVKDELTELSYSGVNAYQDCEFRFWMTYILGFQTPTIESQVYGNLVHSALQIVNNEIKAGKELKLRDLRKISEDICKDDQSKARKDELYHNLDKYYDNFKASGSKVLEVEFPFSYIQNDLAVKGYADLIVENSKGEIEVIDFKSHKQSGLSKQHVDLQLRLYNLSLDKVIYEKYGKKISNLKAYTFMDQGEKLYSNTEKDLSDTRGIVENVTTSIEKGDFSQNWESGFCKTRNEYCALYDHCKRTASKCKILKKEK